MDERPAYLTDATLAHAERDRWEAQFATELLTWARRAQTGQALTASGFPFWDRAMKGLARAVRLPTTILKHMLAHHPVAKDETPEQVAKRLAATLATAAFNVHMLEQLAQYGIPYKVWRTQHDGRVRPAHASVDGQVRRLSQPWMVGGYAMHYPADSRTAPIQLWMNERCVLIGTHES